MFTTETTDGAEHLRQSLKGGSDSGGQGPEKASVKGFRSSSSVCSQSVAEYKVFNSQFQILAGIYVGNPNF
ncbi:MAG: hypothetical protein ACI399_03490 [Candidatus Cryptobacteroides sp.]